MRCGALCAVVSLGLALVLVDLVLCDKMTNVSESATHSVSPNARRVRETRRRRKRGLRLFKVEVAIADLEVVAKHDYPDLLSSDVAVRSKALEAFISECASCLNPR
jgi:hypothetical protein